MKKTIFIILITFTFLLTSCENNEPEPSGTEYLDKQILVDDLISYVSDVINNDHLIEYINTNYSNNKLTNETYNNYLNNAKNHLLELEKNKYINIYNLDENYFDNINEITLIYPYVAINEETIKKLSYEYDLNYINDNYKIASNNEYILLNSNFELVQSDLLINEQLINQLNLEPKNKETDDNKYLLYLVNKSNVYEIILHEKNNSPYIFNAFVYTDFSEDVVIITEPKDGILNVSEGNLDPNYFEVIDNKIIIDKDYLRDLFNDGRDDFIFGISFVAGNHHILRMLFINKD